MCQKILNARKDKKCIVFAPTIKICESVGTDYILHSRCTKKKNSETLTQFNNALFGSIGSSKALTEGVDVKGLSVGIIMNVNSSKITAVQKRGRICRFEPGKKAEMFTLVLKGTQEYQ
ncbi:MAG: helicase-related protein [Candidatus Onthovivens sp.]|nr:helicase-related protein [Candidatus Onthovivens sp.]